MTGSISIDGITIARDSDNFGNLLASAHARKQRPLCMCTTPPVPMSIARLSDSLFILKRMPLSGMNHHPSCDSYEPPQEMSGRGALSNNVISEDMATGVTLVKIDFPLTKTSRKAPDNKGEATAKTSVHADPAKMSIRGLLHYLYEEANFNRWSPKMSGKRNWYVIQKYLRNAAANVACKKVPLADALYIPEPFSPNHADEIAGKFRNFCGKLRENDGKQRFGMLIGEVKRFEPARFGQKMLVKHMPASPLYIDDGLMNRTQKAFERELAFFAEDESIHLLCICTFAISASMHPHIEHLSLMTVDEQWLPFDQDEDKKLVQTYVAKQQSFIKPLRYNLAPDSILAALIHTANDTDPVAIYTPPLGADEHYMAELERIRSESSMESTVVGP